MDELQELENLVEGKNGLIHLSDPKEIVKRLQEIEKNILLYYYIQIGDIKIYPLLVEAYYKSQSFKDEYTHGSPRQCERFGEIYIHEKGYGGIDLCLSNGKYALSFLIKNSLVYIPNSTDDIDYEIFFTQTQLYDFLKNDKNCGFCYIKNKDKEIGNYYELKKESALKRGSKRERDRNIIYLRRKGLETADNIRNNNYKDKEHFDCPLAGFFFSDMKYPLTFEGGKGEAAIEYINKHEKDFQNQKEKIEFANHYANYCPEKIRNGEI